MENLPVAQNASKRRFGEMSFRELFLPPFPVVAVLRPLGCYGRMLDLEPMVPTVPNPEFLVRLLTGHASHQACIRHEAGSKYKNLENLIRGRHKVSPTTKQLLVGTLGISIDDLEMLYASAPEGPLLPGILAVFQISEGLPMRITTGLLDREVSCPCCGKNLLDDVDAWWSRHTPGMGRAEYHFAERLLNAVVGAGLIERFIGLFEKRTELFLDRLGSLSEPSRYPIGNWLAEAQTTMSCNSLSSFAAAMQLRGDAGALFSHGRLKKWSAGQDVMPMDAGEAIAKACAQPKGGVRRLIAARAIALTVDFVSASLPQGATFGRREAQSVVHARLEHLGASLRIALSAIQGQTMRPAPDDQLVSP